MNRLEWSKSGNAKIAKYGSLTFYVEPERDNGASLSIWTSAGDIVCTGYHYETDAMDIAEAIVEAVTEQVRKEVAV